MSDPARPSGVEVLTFGCRLNAYESEALRHAVAATERETVIVNTCAVTGEAVRQAEQAIRRARRERPGARIVVTGCAAQIEPERFARMEEVDLVLGNGDKVAPERFARKLADPAQARVEVNDIMALRETGAHLIDGFAERARAFVEVQNGCDHRCTFCVIPFGRGPSRSVPPGVVVEQIRRLVDAGLAEVVLTGVDLTAYGADLPGQPTLGRLVQQILTLAPGLKRLRLSSIDSIEADPALVDCLVGEARVMPHVHLSLQAGDDLVLARMKRRHRRQDALEFCDALRARRPDIVFGADLIAGFPTETEAMFAQTLSLIEACGLVYTHVFPYSPRPGTPARRMPQIERGVIRERARRLREAGTAARTRFFAAQVGRLKTALVETPLGARTDDYAPVRLERPAEPGSVITVKVTAADAHGLAGSAAA